MLFESIIEKHRLHPFVKEIFHLKNRPGGGKKKRLAFYADGFPGIVFIQAEAPAFLLPEGKPLSPFFIYGLTIHPLELDMTGNFSMLVFQLQPFAIRTLFGVNPKLLNDDCHDLSAIFAGTLRQLQLEMDAEKQVEIIAKFIAEKAEGALTEKGGQIQMAIGMVLSSGGKKNVRELARQLHLTERTLQRLFMEYVGLSPKQFAKIVQFQHAFSQLSDESFNKFTEVVFENGYADQSHFIRNFRRFTGGKPSDFK